MDNAKLIKTIDKLISLFMIIFLLSLTNSIFLNQIGYYGSLLLFLIRYFISKKNSFEKSGLELAFIWFILAELISALLSENQSQALNHFLRRVLLVPVVYVTIAAVKNYRTGVKYFWVYIGASLITSIIYIYFAYDNYVYGAYGLDEAATSFFQYPITAGEIISFSVIFLFTFLINEKVNWRYKLLLLIATGIAFLSLIATYKRTGWVGTFAGIFIILLLKKEWRIIIPAAVLLVIFILLQENISRVYVYDYDNYNLKNIAVMETEGRATNTFPTDSGFILCDYENGVIVYEDTSVVHKLLLPAPVVAFHEWKDNNYVAQLNDTRFFLLRKKNKGWEIKDEFISPGFTSKSVVSNGKFYVLDADSGFTIFNSSDNVEDITRYSGIKNYSTFSIDSDFVMFYSSKKGIKIFGLNEGELTSEVIDSALSKDIGSVYYFNSRLLLSKENIIKLYRVDNTGLTLIDSVIETGRIYQWYLFDEKLFAAGAPSIIYQISAGDKINILSRNSLEFFPQSLSYSNNKIYLTYVYRSKLNSIWDPLMPSNAVRLSLWRTGWEIFKDYPVFGVGDIHLQEYHKKYKRYNEKQIHGHLHNNFVHVLATLGLFGFLAVCFLLVKIYIIDLRIYRKSEGKKFISSYSLGVIGTFTAFIVSGLTEMNIWDHEIITLVYFTFGLNIAFYLFNNQSEKIERSSNEKIS